MARSHLYGVLQGNDIRARALRSSAMVAIGFGGSNVLRLISNLVLTRLLFPEAFGIMSLVYVFLIGLHMLSDFGFNVSIIQNKQGEEPAFLDTVWSLQIIRGVLLWLGACALAYPAALIYDEPQLAQLLPIVGLTALIQGFTTTKVALANRNLQIGVQVTTEIGSYAVSLIITIFGAWLTGSVWSLVVGALFGAIIKVVAQHIFIEGHKNRWHLDYAMLWDIVNFGKYIFLASGAAFLINQSDRAILGGYVSLTELGVYTVGFMFASVPIDLARTASGKIIFPLFGKFPPLNNDDNRNKVLKARRLVVLTMAFLIGVLSLVSVSMIDFLYDSRYHNAGPILVLLCFTVTVQVATSTYDGSYLSAGNSELHFRIISAQAVIQVIASIVLISKFGTLGAIFALGLSQLISYPLKAYAANKYNSWDPKTDFLVLGIGWGSTAAAAYIWQEAVLTFAQNLGSP